MFKLFKKNKPTITSVSIPTFGWDLVKNDNSIKLWINPDQTIALSVNFFDQTPDIPTIQNIERIRSLYRETNYSSKWRTYSS